MIRQLMNLCGIDIGCTNIKMTAFAKNTLKQKTVPSGDTLSREKLIEIISEFYISCNYDFNGIGIAFSGCTIDSIRVNKTSLKCLEDLSIYDFAHLNCKNIRLINDSNATALAGLIEYPKSKVLISITNGTGIGCGIVINGRLFTGANGLAGEIYGNPTISHDEIIKTGKICSGSKVLRELGSISDSNSKVIDQAASYMGIEIVSLIHSYNPDIIYLSGGGFDFPGYIESLTKFIYQHTYPDFLTNLNIVRTNFASYSGCFGAMKYIALQ